MLKDKYGEKRYRFKRKPAKSSKHVKQIIQALDMKSAPDHLATTVYETVLDKHRLTIRGNDLSIKPPRTYPCLERMIQLQKENWSSAPSVIQVLFGSNGYELLPAGDNAVIIDSTGIMVGSPTLRVAEVHNLIKLSYGLMEEKIRRLARERLLEPEQYNPMACLVILKKQELSAEEKSAVRTCLKAANPKVRFTAAGLLGSEGLDLLFEVVVRGSLQDAEIALAVSSDMSGVHDRMFEAVAKVSNRENLMNLLEALPAPRNERQADLILAGCRRCERMLEQSQKPDRYEWKPVLLAGIRQLGRYPRKISQDYLANLFWENLDPDIRLQVARSLENGNLEVVESLYPFLENRPDSELKTTVATTIQMIQARQGNVEPGWLSMGETETGGLSIALEEQGGLSLADEPENQ